MPLVPDSCGDCGSDEDEHLACETDSITVCIPGMAALIGPVGPTGATGPTGETGPSGIGDAQAQAFMHSQGIPSDIWTIDHNLGFMPNITVQDTAGTTVEGEIDYVTNNQVVMTFSAAFSGEAYLS